MAVYKLETSQQKSQKQVKELLREWLEREDIEEVFLLGKTSGKKFSWDHSFINSTFWWIGFLKFVGDIISDWQSQED